MRICFFGDSFVNGTGDDDCLGWPGRLCADSRQRGHDVTLYNLGIRGDTSADIAARWEHEASIRLPVGYDGRLVFSFGVNDCGYETGEQRRVCEDATLINARSILERAQPRWPTLMVGPPYTAQMERDQRVKRLSEQLERLCLELKVPFLPVFTLMEGNEIWRQETECGDGTHPNRLGYTLIYQAVLGWQAWRDWAP